MPKSNGRDQGYDHGDDQQQAIDQIREMAERIPQSLTAPLERVRDSAMPFEQKAHSLLMESVDKITQQWVGELGQVRMNTETIEGMVTAQAAKVKEEITKLHLLGVQAMKEAQRGHEVTQYLGEQLETMMTGHAGEH